MYRKLCLISTATTHIELNQSMLILEPKQWFWVTSILTGVIQNPMKHNNVKTYIKTFIH